jgi:hypothetical protein
MDFLSLVIPVGKSQAELLANVLCRVFYDEPRFAYLMPDANERRRVLPGLFSSAIRAGQLYGETYTTPGVEGGSVWIGPGRSLAIHRLLQTGSPTMSLKISWASLKRSVRLAAWTEEVRQRLARQPHWYLAALGVESSKQDKVLREALIEPGLLRADADGLPCCLETFHETDLPFYREHGFRIEGGGRTPGGGPNFWILMRAPRRLDRHGAAISLRV